MFSYNSEPFSLERDCKAIVIPYGEEVRLVQGMIGYITQTLGGSFTVYIDGNLFRIAGEDADALGKEPVPPPSLPDDASNTDVGMQRFINKQHHETIELSPLRQTDIKALLA